MISYHKVTAPTIQFINYYVFYKLCCQIICVILQEVLEVKKRRHRKSTQQVDPMEEKKNKIMEMHPLTVEITAKLENGFSVTVTFQYRAKLKIVTVTSKSNIPSNITGNTFLYYINQCNLNNFEIDRQAVKLGV